MSLTSTLLLGLVAGSTILLGLPVGRLRRPAPSLRMLLSSTAVGVLLFLVWDVLSAMWEPIDAALVDLDQGGLSDALGYGMIATVGLSVGLLSLVQYEKWMGRRLSSQTGTGRPRPYGPGATAVGELQPASGVASWSAAKQLSLMIAVGIGLHNFAEGLAIGQSAASGEIGLAVVLVIGFGLHNATEGFGIVAPLAGDRDHEGRPCRPSWGFLLAMGAIAGGPTFVGAVVGHGFTSEAVSVAFLSLAAGSLIYVITQLISVAAKARRNDLLAYGILIGLLAGFVTDAILTGAGV